MHHGIRIQDAALVAAARLSHRYIPARQLPDKAIDLVDEAASRLKMEIESVPEPIDQVNRRIATLEVERAALNLEKDRRSKQRLPEVERELAELREQLSTLKAQWQQEREVIERLHQGQAALESARIEADKAQKSGDFARASELRYGRIPELERKLAADRAAMDQLQASGISFLREEVTEDDIAAVVSKWTGIPVEKMLEGEVDRLKRFARRFAGHGLRPGAMTPVYGLAECSVALAFPPIGRGPRVDRSRASPFSARDTPAPQVQARRPRSSSSRPAASCPSTRSASWTTPGATSPSASWAATSSAGRR